MRHLWLRASTGSLAALGLCMATAARADVPPRTATGQTLAVPAAQLELGEVYHVTPGAGTQLTWTMETPVLRTVAVCNRVVGYLLTPFDLEEGQPPLLAGALRIPVASLRTGLTEADAQWHGPQMLDAAAHPEITFEITEVSDVRPAEQEHGRRSYTLTVAGHLQLKDRQARVEFPATLAFVPFTWQTVGLNLGDLAILRARFDVKSRDLGLPEVGPRERDLRADVQTLDFHLLASTSPPDLLIEPDIPREQHEKRLWFLTLLRDFDDPQRAYDFGRAYLREIWNDPQALRRLAWATLTEDHIRIRDLEFAWKAAQRANHLTNSKDGPVLATLAQAYYQRGEPQTALKLARQSVQHLAGQPPYVAAEVRAQLERLEAAAQPPPDWPDSQPTTTTPAGGN